MTDSPNFSVDPSQFDPQLDIQQKILNNALARFCDQVEQDERSVDQERGIITRLVVWRFGKYRFRAKLVTFDSEATSIGQFDYTQSSSDDDWYRLTTPRALAEMLAQAGSEK